MSKTKKKWAGRLGALVCSAASAPVLAQSSVTLYGTADVFLGSIKALGAAHSAVTQKGGGMTTSFFGFKGTEDLGGGYSTFFVLESYFQPNTGTYGRSTTDSFFSRNAYAGIATPYGSIRAGRLTTQLYLATIQFNPFYNSYTFSPWIYHVYQGIGPQGVVGDSAWNNAVAYVTPWWHGVNASAMYAFGNTAGDAGAHKWGGQVQYTHGAFAASLNYQYINFNLAAGDIGTAVGALPGFQSQATAQGSLSYDFKFVKLYANYMNVRDKTVAGTANTNSEQIGVTVPAYVGYVMASFAFSKSTGAESAHARRNTWAGGYDYPLSKRTDVYAAIKWDHFAAETAGLTYGGGIRTSF